MITEEKLNELRNEHGDVYVIGGDGGPQIVVRMPKPDEFDRFTATVSDPKKSSSALRQLVRDVVLHPSRAEYEAMCAKRPGLPLSFGKAVVDLSGASMELEAKKA